ncbi:ABC transporter related [Desulfamplus magnetovallimortis]|uniref:ABC transporter related n=1 Tax=Desulfamplus magnetovallimortis TaxID=1246637 RepID=A0A1W1HJ06_9BACT|nr:ABC transporter ATP-binding protein [Desulfamplus magnetovallimortis]SLM32440.1 ABC transporter related [Desulfamplus magnetovallimortis]
MLEIKNVTKKFGELTAVNNLSFTVEKGQVFGIAGPNGAGKSTLYNLITGLYPFEGSIKFEGKEIRGFPSHKIAKLGIARTFQIPQTFPSLTVKKSIAIGNYFGSDAEFDPAYVDEILKFVNLYDKQDEKTGQLKLLDKKMLMIAAALGTRPKILMLDEPMAGSNSKEILSLMELIKRINQDMGITIIIIEHFMKVLTELTSKLLIIETGTEICCGDPNDVTSDSRVIECYLGDGHD